MASQDISSSPVLVSGAAGFIGFHVALRLLQAGRAVVGIDNMNDYYDVQLKTDRLVQLQKYDAFFFVKQDIADFEGMKILWAERGPFVEVIHLAAQAGVRYSLKNPHAYVSSNIVGHLNILELCRYTDGFRHLVYASSSSVYGKNDTLPYSVKDRVDQPVSLYAATKKSGEMISYSYSHLYKIPQTGLRFFTVYGPWGRPDMSPYIFTRAIDKGEKVPIFNNGDMRRDFTFIDDVSQGVLDVLLKPPVMTTDTSALHRVLNLGNTRSVALMDFVGAIEKALDKKADINFMPMQDGDVRETFADISETRALTGFDPKTTIYEGIPAFIEWYRSYYNHSR